MSDPNLFDYAQRYPHQPASRNTDTSRASAEAMKPKVKTLRDQILELLRSGLELTPDEASERLGISLLSGRPRFTELDRLGLIVPTGQTRINSVSGHKAQVYRISAHGEK